MRIVFVVANSIDLDEMPQPEAFHLGHHCLSKNLLSVFLYTKGYSVKMGYRYIEVIFLI